MAGTIMSTGSSNSAPAMGTGLRRPGGVRFAQLHLLADEARDLAVSPVTASQGGGQIDDLHPFAQGLFDFMGKGRHFFPGAAVDDGHLGAQAPGGAGHVDGHVAAADDRQPFAHRQGLAQIVAAQELHPLDHARRRPRRRIPRGLPTWQPIPRNTAL